MKKILLLLALGGCSAVGPDYRRPAVELPASFPVSTSQENPTVQDDWWKLYRDPVLDELVATVRANNADIRLAAAQVLEIEAVLRQVDAARLPEVSGVASRHPTLKLELGAAVDVPGLLERNPIEAFVQARGTGGVAYFKYQERIFGTTFPVSEADRGPLQEMVREIVDWRLARYLQRTERQAAQGIVCSVKQSNGRPMIFLPEGPKREELPSGAANLTVDGTVYEADFVKIALNVVRIPGTEANVLPELLRGWFGPDAGQPGTTHQVMLEQGQGWVMRPAGRREGHLDLWQAYSREQIPPLFGHAFSQAIWNAGFVVQGKDVFLLVTLDKGGHGAEFKYKDKFLSPTLFQWESQNRQRRDSDQGRLLQDHVGRGVKVHLFVRRQKRHTTGASRFFYCGPVEFRDWEGDRPITIRWELSEPVPERLWKDLAPSP